MNQIKVSIIIPVYNTEKYVQATIESILQQTLKEIELIIINDGSIDSSLSILEKLVQQDSRISIYTQRNRGLSVSRNEGLKHVQGEFIYFMDSDDLLSPDTLEQCYQKCVSNNLDFVFFDADILNEDNSLTSIPNYKRDKFANENTVYKGNEILNILMNNWVYSSSVCLNLIRTTYLKQTDNYFYPGIIHEDQLFTCLLYIQAERIMYISKAFFKRRIRTDSIMTRKFSWKNINGYFTVSDCLLRFKSRQSSVTQATIDKYLSNMLNAVMWQAHILPLKEKLKILRIGLKKYRSFISIKSFIILIFK